MLSQAIWNDIATANKIKQTQMSFLYLRKKDKHLYDMIYLYKMRYQKVIQNAGKEKSLKNIILKEISF